MRLHTLIGCVIFCTSNVSTGQKQPGSTLLGDGQTRKYHITARYKHPPENSPCDRSFVVKIANTLHIGLSMQGPLTVTVDLEKTLPTVELRGYILGNFRPKINLTMTRPLYLGDGTLINNELFVLSFADSNPLLALVRQDINVTLTGKIEERSIEGILTLTEANDKTQCPVTYRVTGVRTNQ